MFDVADKVETKLQSIFSKYKEIITLSTYKYVLKYVNDCRMLWKNSFYIRIFMTDESYALIMHAIY